MLCRHRARNLACAPPRAGARRLLLASSRCSARRAGRLAVRAEAEAEPTTAAPSADAPTPAGAHNGAAASTEQQPPAAGQQAESKAADWELPEEELAFEEPSGGQKAWTSVKLAFALPWRRFKSESVLTLKLSGQIAEQPQVGGGKGGRVGGRSAASWHRALPLAAPLRPSAAPRSAVVQPWPRLQPTFPDLAGQLRASHTRFKYTPPALLPSAPPPHTPLAKQGRFSKTVSLPALCECLQKAARDPRVVGVCVKVEPLACGWGKLQELRRHIELFKQSGGPCRCATPPCARTRQRCGGCGGLCPSLGELTGAGRQPSLGIHSTVKGRACAEGL